ncbi:receptor-like kinase [Medicago truncatula]|uniref:non-specific serine/threonine protein kinase n=1 Tax=Medicago truncatula TaxID=3880 RepID=G7K224_MEDTR|nr:receptor-like kinase [Medicago truncatula]
MITTLQKRKSTARSSSKREVTTFTDLSVPLTYENVVQATGNFNLNNLIGGGRLGSTYKAEISKGFFVAVKRLYREHFEGAKHFNAEIKALENLNHPNLITLIGYTRKTKY